MAWYDKYKQETILICDHEEHNKFWAAQLDPNIHTVSIRWGRLGTKGQSQLKQFPAQYAAANFIETKMREKRNKGYMPIEQKKFDQLSIQAAIVGTANKCSEFKWVEVTDEGRKFHQVSEERLADPECNPGLYMEIETKKEYGNKHKFNLLFTFTQVFEVTQKLHGINSTYVCEPVTKDSPIHELTTKAEEALGRSFST